MSLRLRTACTRLAASALALMFGTSTLLADVTPEQVWQAWQLTFTAGGNTVTAKSARREGDTLSIKDITIKTDQDAEVQFSSISFKDRGDGTVAVILPETYPVTLHLPAPPGGAFFKSSDIEMTVSTTGAAFLARGTPEAITLTFDIASLVFKLSRINGVFAANMGTEAHVRMMGVSIRNLIAPGAKLHLVNDYTVKTLALTATAPSGGNNLHMALGVEDLTLSTEQTQPKGVQLGAAPEAMAAALAAGVTMSLKATYGDTRLSVSTLTNAELGKPNPGRSSEVIARAAKGEFDFALDGTRLDYRQNSEGGSFKVITPEIPFANAKATYGTFAAHILFPVAEGPRPAPYALGLTLTDVTLSDAIWAFIDPAKALPHDPASLDLDAGGKITVRHSPFLHPEGKVGLPVGEQRAELNRLDIANLNVKAVGAEVTALGGLTMDYGTPGHALNPPVPSGKIDLKATGLGKLIDTLVKMDVIAPQEAMQARMMLAIFAISSTTADAQTSTVEFRDAHLFVNGQKVQ